jgi:hypothetical protein
MGGDAVIAGPAYSASGCPVSLHPGDGFVLAHGGHVSLAKTSTRNEEMYQVCGQCFSRRLRCSSVRLDAALDARPEGSLVYVKLISENVAPYFLPVAAPVHWMRNPCPEDSPVVEMKLVGDVMRTGSALRVSYGVPAFGRAESLVILARRRWPGHRAGPASHSRSCSSSLRPISCTRPQLSRWLAAFSR